MNDFNRPPDFDPNESTPPQGGEAQQGAPYEVPEDIIAENGLRLAFLTEIVEDTGRTDVRVGDKTFGIIDASDPTEPHLTGRLTERKGRIVQHDFPPKRPQVPPSI